VAALVEIAGRIDIEDSLNVYCNIEIDACEQKSSSKNKNDKG
jgi:hypothetical protein